MLLGGRMTALPPFSSDCSVEFWVS